MKKLLSLCLTLALLMLLLPLAASAAMESVYCGENLTWSMDDQGTMTITGTGPMYDIDYNGVPYSKVFDQIKKVIVSEGVTYIGAEAFLRCTSLTQVILPESLTGIGDWAFTGCTGLTEITIPGSVTSVGERAFQGCSALTALTLSEGVSNVGEFAFAQCTALTKAALPGSLGTVTDRMFYECTNLTEVTLAEGITAIGQWAFCEDANLDSIVFPASLTTIGTHAFYMCTGLTEVTIPATVTAMEDGIFSNCTGLKKLTLAEGSTAVPPGLAMGCTSLAELSLPATVTEISSSAFSGCTSLTAFTVPSGVTTIGNSAFQGCTGLKTMVIPGGISRIGEYLFGYCSNLTEVTLEEGVAIIDDYAFRNCTGLTNLTMPASIQTIENYAFSGCTALNSLVFTGNAPQFSTNTFDNAVLTAEYPADNATWTAEVMQDYTGSITWIPSSDCDHLPVNCNDAKAATCTEDGHTENTICSLCGLTLKKGQVLYAQGHHFQDAYCTVCGELQIFSSGRCGDNLTWVLDGKGVLTISGTGPMKDYSEDGPGLSDSRIKKIVIEEGVTTIGTAAFHNSEYLVELTLPETLTSIGESAFLGCTRLVDFDIPASVTSIGGWAFQGCHGLRYLTLPATVTEMGPYIYNNCIRLKYVTLPDTMTLIPEGTFWKCDIATIDLPKNLTAIGPAAFANCTTMTEITIPAGVTEIGEQAFSGSTKLKNITFAGNAPAIGEACFQHVTAKVHYTANKTWTEDVRENYGGTLTWLPKDSSCKHDKTSLSGKKSPTCTEAGYTGDTVCSGCKVMLRKGEAIAAKGHTVVSGTCNVCRIRIDGSTGVCGDSVIWTLDSKGTLTISGKGPMYNFSDSLLPPYLERVSEIKKIVIKDGVTAIGDMAFILCVEATQVTIPSSVTYMGPGAFVGCVKLTSVTIPGSIPVIPTLAFEECYALKTLVLSKGVTTIEPYAFSFCTALTDVTLPSTLTTLDIGAFWKCQALAKISLPGNLTAIGGGAFAECTALTSITIPGKVKEIGEMAFQSCSSLSSITFKGNVPAIAQDAFTGVTAKVSWPKDNGSWKYAHLQDYGGSLTWDGKDKLCPHQETRTEGAKEPTCTANGHTGKTLCSKCGETLSKGESIPKLGHSYEGGICIRCGEIDPTLPIPDSVTRLAGENRFDTAFLAANQMKQNLGIEKFDIVVVASGMDFADALSGSYLAAVKNAPILLASQVEKYNDLVKDYIRENLTEGGTIYILGGVNAIPDSFKTGLDAYTITRLAGDNRFDTNLKVLAEAGVGDKPILVCTGGGFADSLSASATKLPILLVYGNELLPDQKTFLEANQGRDLYIIGGTSAVSAELEAQLSTYSTPKRVAGNDRFQTSVLIAETFFDTPNSAVLAYAWNFPDGLCGGPLAATMNAPLILTMPKYETQAANYIQSKNIQTGVTLGGASLIPNASVNTIFGIR